ncbi:hypothetical protein [Falsiroseomonas sp.]|uniref:hypothetical protein n=1 Tax=Falsiroseomonas sp. TaxID=2870721 RepID=UPI0035655EDA
MAFFWRVWLAVAGINAIVLTLFVTLAALQFDAIQSSLAGERLTLLAARTAAPFEQAARIGLGIAAVRNAEGLLERTRQTDEAIGAIHVFGPEGRILHSTDPLPPSRIPAAALVARAAAGGAPWHHGGRDAFLAGVEIASRSGASLGGVLIVYSAAQNAARVGAMTTELILAGIVVLLGSMALGAPLLRIGLRGPIRAFDAIEEAVEGFERDAWRSAAGDRPAARATAAAEDMRGMLDEAEHQYRSAGRSLAAARDAA